MSRRKKDDPLLGPHMCPVCGKTEFPRHLSFEICEECGWEDDVLDPDDPDDFTGANPMELEEYRAAYQSGWRPDWLKDQE